MICSIRLASLPALPRHCQRVLFLPPLPPRADLFTVATDVLSTFSLLLSPSFSLPQPCGASFSAKAKMASYSPVPNPAAPEHTHAHSSSPSLSHVRADGRRDSSDSLASSRRDSRALPTVRSPPAQQTRTGIRPLSLLQREHRDSSATVYSLPPESGDGEGSSSSGTFTEKMGARHPNQRGPPHGSRESTLTLTIPPGQLYPPNFDATLTMETGWKKYKRMKSLAPGWGRSIANVALSSCKSAGPSKPLAFRVTDQYSMGCAYALCRGKRAGLHPTVLMDSALPALVHDLDPLV